MSIPLVQNNEKDSINTSIIAIKRNIERINMLLGLSNSEEIDTSEFVKKSDIVDEVTIGNMQSVTSNAVAKAMSYSTEEQFTGKYWLDGKKIYRKRFICNTSRTILSNSVGGARYSFTGTENIAQSIDTLISTNLLKNNKTIFSIDAYISTSSPIDVVLCNYTTRELTTEVNNTILILEYTKTTD